MTDASVATVFAAIEGVAVSASAPVVLILFTVVGCALTVLLANIVASYGLR